MSEPRPRPAVRRGDRRWAGPGDPRARRRADAGQLRPRGWSRRGGRHRARRRDPRARRPTDRRRRERNGAVVVPVQHRSRPPAPAAPLRRALPRRHGGRDLVPEPGSRGGRDGDTDRGRRARQLRLLVVRGRAVGNRAPGGVRDPRQRVRVRLDLQLRRQLAAPDPAVGTADADAQRQRDPRV